MDLRWTRSKLLRAFHERRQLRLSGNIYSADLQQYDKGIEQYAKATELAPTNADIKPRIDGADRSHHEMADLAIKVLELSQTLREKWLTANYPEKRQILEILCLNYRLDDVSLYVEMRKPFDVLAKGLDSEKSRRDSDHVEPLLSICLAGIVNADSQVLQVQRLASMLDRGPLMLTV